MAVVDAPLPSPAASGTTTAISAPATVSAGANVLVVLLATRGGGSAYSDPSTLSWSSQTLTQVVTATDNTSTYRNASIYYLFNPAPGTALNVTGTGGTGTTFWALKSYTLSGVDNAVSPLTGSVINIRGSCHIFTSRWPTSTTFPDGYRQHSESVRAEASKAEGAYTFKEVVLGSRAAGKRDSVSAHTHVIYKGIESN